MKNSTREKFIYEHKQLSVILSSDDKWRNNSLIFNLIMLSFIIFTPVLEYDMVNPDVEKHSGHYFSSANSITDKLMTSTSLNQ